MSADLHRGPPVQVALFPDDYSHPLLRSSLTLPTRSFNTQHNHHFSLLFMNRYPLKLTNKGTSWSDLMRLQRMTELCLEARGSMEKVGSSLIQLMIGISLICGIEAIRRRLGPMRAAETVRPAQAREPAHVSQANVDLYLRVMRATAERARNPAPQDLTTMAAFRRIRYGPRSAATKLRPEEQEIVQRASLLINALDEIVAQEK